MTVPRRGFERRDAADPAADMASIARLAAVYSEAIESFEFVFNTTLPGVIRVDGDRAFARFPVTELAKRRDGAPCTS